MADQVFAVSSGFYDAVNSDRTYSADDMNRPYKRVVSNGVFATPQGTKSTDLQVVSANNGMQIIVQKGEGIFADKWFENPAAINITVPANTSTVPRIDSVIVQVDKRTSGRVGNIVYRTGTPSVNPVAPSINTVSNVTEYRLANVRVETGTTAITTAMITDRRGSSDCPWVTSLIYQVDTSVLYDQWAAAYEEYFQAEKEMWDDWYSHLTQELDVSLTLVKRTHTFVTISETDTIDIGIPEYNADTDMLEIYINGLRAIEGNQYTINGSTSITLSAPLSVGQTVDFIVLKSVVMGNTDDIITLINALEDRIATIQGGNPTVVSSASDMTDTDKIYILSTDSKWYYYNLSSSAWVAGGVYGGVPTDTTLTQAGMAADAKAVGDALAGIENGLSTQEKALILSLFADAIYSSSSASSAYDALAELWDSEPVPLNLLYDWNLKSSLIDTVGNRTALTNGTVDSSGVTFDAQSKYIQFSGIYDTDRTYQIDISHLDCKTLSSANKYARLWMIGNSSNTDSGASGFIISTVTKNGDAFYNNAWESPIIPASQDNKGALFSGKTASFYVRSDRKVEVYIDGVLMGTSSTSMPEPSGQSIIIGSAGSDFLYDAVFTGLRVYRGLVLT